MHVQKIHLDTSVEPMLRIDHTGQVGLFDQDAKNFIDYFYVTSGDQSNECYLVWREYQHNSLFDVHKSSDFWSSGFKTLENSLVKLNKTFINLATNTEKDSFIYQPFSSYGTIHAVANKGEENEAHFKLTSQGLFCRAKIIRQPVAANQAFMLKMRDSLRRYHQPEPEFPSCTLWLIFYQ